MLYVGIDEAGRGALAGPVVAAAVVLKPGNYLTDRGVLADSKKLSTKRRAKLYTMICEEALDYGVGFAEAEEIDEINILQATLVAMQRAVQALTVSVQHAKVDGNQAPLLAMPVETLVKGDSLDASISAASIVAKVTRDKLMLAYATDYPEYGFAQHKGYGTKAHYIALQTQGPTILHRRSFRLR